jgi:peptide/nickel transport system substrate-binding protein
MNSRFSIKDFFFSLLLLAVIVVGIMALGQFNFLNRQIINLGQQLQTVNQQQIQQTSELQEIINKGVSVNSSGENNGGPGKTATTTLAQNIRETLPDGSQYVYYPNIPVDPHDPYSKPDYAPGDWLVDNLGAEPVTLTPYVVKDYEGEEAQMWTMETLLIQNPVTLEFEPWLAESYRISADGLTITFKLRKNARFSDGMPVTAQDVVFSYNTIMNPDVDAAPLRSYLETIKSCTAVGTDTVIFKFKRPYFLSLAEAGSFQIIPEHIYQFAKGSDFNNRAPSMENYLVGSGPYIFKEWVPGQQLIFVRNPNYWGPYPIFDRIDYRFILNPQAALQSYINGEIDFDGVVPEQWVKYSADPDFMKNNTCRTYYRIDYGYIYIGWNLTKPMFQDVQTRTALAMLIDREGIIKTFLYGMAEQITGPFSPLSPQYDPSIKPLPYDSVGAQKLLAQAGWRMGPDGILERNGQEFKFQLQIGTDEQLVEDMASYMKQQFAGAGIDMEIEPEEGSVLSQNIDKRNFDAMFAAWSGSPEDDPYQIFDSASIANQGSNYVSYSDPEADKLMAEARVELNDDKRMKLWHQLQAVIYRDQPYMFLYVPQLHVFINPRFRNTEIYPKLGLGQPPGGSWYVPLDLQKYH